jgi:hypothetical protein
MALVRIDLTKGEDATHREAAGNGIAQYAS